MSRARFGLPALLAASAVGTFLGSIALASPAFAQGQALPEIKVNLPPPPNFDVAPAPVQHPTGEFSVYGPVAERHPA